ncbi:MAG: hypothetical protein Q4C96_01145 [Planctomycetia bacterium]|nr:hypothetical protein [Planctomycetia bacterium]
MITQLKNLWIWLENLWKLREIFDKYLPMIREIYEEIQKLRQENLTPQNTSKTTENLQDHSSSGGNLPESV